MASELGSWLERNFELHCLCASDEAEGLSEVAVFRHRHALPPIRQTPESETAFGVGLGTVRLNLSPAVLRLRVHVGSRYGCPVLIEDESARLRSRLEANHELLGIDPGIGADLP